MPTRYDWANPAYGAFHSAIVPCQENLVAGLTGAAPAETSGDDNLKTLRLVFGDYDSANTGQAIHFD